MRPRRCSRCRRLPRSPVLDTVTTNSSATVMTTSWTITATPPQGKEPRPKPAPRDWTDDIIKKQGPREKKSER